jgi:uncharacterized protein (TIGR03437 family)
MYFRRFLPALLAAIGAACAFAADNRVTATIDNNRRVVLKGHIRPEVQPQNDRGPADPTTEIAYATLLLKVDPSIATFLVQQQTPGSPVYRKWLTPEQFGTRFGAGPNDMAKIVAWIESQGLRVHDVARGRHWITFSGTAATVGRAFGTEIHSYVVNGETHFANATEPSIPEAFAGVFGGFRGLNDFHAQSMAIRASTQPTIQTKGAPSYTNSFGEHLLAPDDLATMYNISSLYQAGIDGTGQTLVIAGESSINLSDIAAFQTRFNLPLNPPQLQLYGTAPSFNGAQVEANLDLEWSGAVARNATIIYAYASNVFTAAQYAVDQNLGQVMSLSFGECEQYGQLAYRGVAQQANAQGITIFVSSGDSAAAGCDRNGPVPQATHGATASWPSSFPEITSVGGTELNDSAGAYWAAQNNANGASALSYIPEVPWNDTVAAGILEGGGGAPSALFAKPYWQIGPGVPADGMRDTPDVSLPASPYQYAYLVAYGGGLIAVGGTSASSPAWAGIGTLLNQFLVKNKVLTQPGLGNINPALYRLAQATTDVFNDVTTGDNKVPCLQGSPDCSNGTLGFAAGPGYDLATGLGSVNVFNFVTEWNVGTASMLTLSADPTTAALTDQVTVTATVTGSGAAPTGTVDFIATNTIGGINLGTAVLTPSGAGTSTATIILSGNQIAIGNGPLQALYSGDAVYVGSSGSTTVSITIPPTTGSLVVPWVTPNPVTETGLDQWHYTVGLTEKAGVATTLTSLRINGVTQSVTAFDATVIPANGSVFAQFVGSGITPPLNRTYVFTGQDAGRVAWTQQITVPFVAPTISATLLNPGIAMSTTPTVFDNLQADPSCEWAVPLNLQETGGYMFQLSKLTLGGVDITPQIPVIFGTTRLAPFGSLQGIACFSSATAIPVAKNFALTATLLDGAIGGTLGASATATLSSLPGPATMPAAVPSSVSLSIDDSAGTASATVNLTAAGSWSASVFPNNQTTHWLTISPTSGTGALTVQANGAGLSPGAYTATILVTANQVLLPIPVTLTVTPSATMTIAGAANSFSGSTTLAPGAMATISGVAMAPDGDPVTSSRFPMPYTLNGVSATVSGVSAPLYSVSSSQIKVQIPYETGIGTATLAINNNGQIATVPIQIASTAPALFTSAFEPLGGIPTTTVNRGQVVMLLMTGEGDVTPTLSTGATPAFSSFSTLYPTPRQAVSLSLAGLPMDLLVANITYGMAGETQILTVIPFDAPLGAQPVIVTVGAAQSQPLMLTVNAGQ